MFHIFSLQLQLGPRFISRSVSEHRWSSLSIAAAKKYANGIKIVFVKRNIRNILKSIIKLYINDASV